MRIGDPRKTTVHRGERRDALVEAAIHEFAHGGLHGTPVDKIARRVGVAQPYVFSLFGSKRELFIAAVERCFERVIELMTKAAEAYDPATVIPPEWEGKPGVMMAMAQVYVESLQTDRDLLMLQLHAYAACDDETIRDHVRDAYARLINAVASMSEADSEQVDDFFRYGMSLNVAAAMGVLDLSCGAEWVRLEAEKTRSQ